MSPEDDAILRAIKEFNGKTSNATAKFVRKSENFIHIEMSGAFCYSLAGVCDYFDDLALELEAALNSKVEVISADRVTVNSYLVIYRIHRD